LYKIKDIAPEELAKITKTPAAGLLVMVPSGEFLLTRRVSNAKYFGGYWSVPSGEVNSKDLESMEECARREFMEETTFQIPLDVKLYCFDRYFSEDRIFFLFVYKANKKMFIKIDEEHDSFGWFSKENSPTPITPQILDAITRI
jgi:8-oxo-dGTP pyrophosphatase MutT (NUDIX family)